MRFRWRCTVGRRERRSPAPSPAMVRCAGRRQGPSPWVHARPLFERLVGAQDNRAAFVALADDLEEQIGPALVDGQVAQLIHDQQVRSGVGLELLHEAAGVLGGGQGVDDDAQVIGPGGQRFKTGPLGREQFDGLASGGAVEADIGNRIEPLSVASYCDEQWCTHVHPLADAASRSPRPHGTDLFTPPGGAPARPGRSFRGRV
jgi:hypothetical protein